MRSKASKLVNSFLDLPLGVRFSLRIVQPINDTRRRLTMDVDLSETNSRGNGSLVTIHGFRVQSYGKAVSAGFKRALRRLAERGFDDPTCVVVKTASGNRSGITHAGGRYIPPDSSFRAEVIRQMQDLGMEPPSPPFIVTPGENTLYHEWGHHIDRTWSGDNQAPRFSFRWFSRYYQLCVPAPRVAHAIHGFAENNVGLQPIDSDLDAASAVAVWWHASSELFANIFEDWMRGQKKVRWDECEPESMNRSVAGGHPSVVIALLPEVRVKDIRAETYALFTSGIRSTVDLPPVRPGLFGANTDELIGRLRVVMGMVRAEQQ